MLRWYVDREVPVDERATFRMRLICAACVQIKQLQEQLATALNEKEMAISELNVCACVICL